MSPIAASLVLIVKHKLHQHLLFKLREEYSVFNQIICIALNMLDKTNNGRLYLNLDQGIISQLDIQLLNDFSMTNILERQNL